MALSQVQCLDENHVNPRTTESKPEFRYCEGQRLALETLLRDGREAFVKCLEERGLRGFLSDPELETLTGAAEPYDPGSDLYPTDSEGQDETPALSQHYWPDLSDTSTPDMDLGWPDSEAYRGVTRTTVYSQPPIEGQSHVKEVIRRMIAAALKVIAVVMDIFTDVDIFRDLLDAGFKRKISVYILLERSTLPHFLSMCQRANMHPGHLKYLRVRCLDGEEFHTRSSTMVKGRMGHRFMFIDGDKAMSGSYSFTWMASRLERNLITVTTGQATTAFDILFRTLFVTSSFVDLQQVATDPEPEPERLPQIAPVTLPSAAVARKLHNPKYALVSFGLPSQSPSSSDVSPKDTPNPDVPNSKKRKRVKPSKELEQEGPPLHPGLVNLEKACMISYLPTWPEPDPPSDVIGFINIIDSSKQNQVHLQRSEMSETSKAVRFSSPLSMPKETLPEVAKPRQMTVKPQEVNKVQPAQNKIKADKSTVEKAQPTQLKSGSGDLKDKTEATDQNSHASGLKGDTAKTQNTQDKPHSNKATNNDAAHNPTTPINANPTLLSSSQLSTPNTSNSPKPNSPLGSNPQKDIETSLETKSFVYRAHSPQLNTNKQTSHLQGPVDSNTEKDALEKPHLDSQTDAVLSTTSATPPKMNQVPLTTSPPTSASTSLSSISSSSSNHPPTSSPKTVTPPLPSLPASASLTPDSTPPVPKPRTIQLVVKDCRVADGQEMPEISVVKRSEKSTESLEVRNDPVPAPMEETALKKVPETVTQLNHSHQGQTVAQKDANNDTPQQKQSRNFCETKKEEVDKLNDNKTGMQSDAAINLEANSDVFIANVPRSDTRNIQELSPEHVETKTLMPTDKLNPPIGCVATAETEVTVPERDLPNMSENVKQNKIYLARPHQLQRISYSELTPQDMGILETVNSTQTSAAHKQGLELANCTDSMPNTAKQNTHSTFQELISKAKESPTEKSLRLHLSDVPTPDPRTPTPEKETWSLAALTRTPTPDGFPSRTSTPDYRTPSSDSRSYTPDFRTPTPDISDGYITPKEDEFTSDEYYECDSPLSEPVFDRAAHHSQGTTEDQVSLTSSPSPTYKSYISRTSLGSGDRITTSNETQSPSGSTRVLSPISLRERKAGEEEGNVREEIEKVGKVSVADRDGTDEAKRPADHLKESKDSTEVLEKNKEAQTQAPKRKRVVNQSGTKRLSDGGSTNEGAEEKRLSAGDLKPQKMADKEKTGNQVALGPSGVEKRDRPLSSRETEGQKVLHTPPRPPRGQQETGSSSPSRQSRPPRPTSGPQPLGTRHWGSSPLNQAESKALDSTFQVSNYTSSPHRTPSRPPPPASGGAVAAASGRKQTEVSQSLQSLLSRQSQPVQGRARAGQLQNNNPLVKSQTSFVRTHTRSEPQFNPPSQIQTVSSKEAHGEEEVRAPFTVTLGRLYGLKGLKDRMSKKGSSSSPAQGRKSTS